MSDFTEEFEDEEVSDDDEFEGPRPRTGDDDYGLGDPLWRPNRQALQVIQEYLIQQPEQDDWTWSDHCEGLAGGILRSLLLAGREVVPIMGKAHWMWAEEIKIHIPCCSVVDADGVWCGNGPLPDHLLASGDCGEHGGS